MTTIHEPARDIPVLLSVDVCIIGGSCTGVFAAVRAARQGASVALVERTNCFGGVATNGMVCIWHTLLDTAYERPVIAGLTAEVIERLGRRGATQRREHNPNVGVVFNPQELKIELDELVREHGIQAHLHAVFAAPVLAEDGTLTHVLIETKDGRRAIAARVFIDASGDGDLAAAVGLPFDVDAHLQPPTTCAVIRGLDGLNLRELWNARCAEYGFAPDAGWSCELPGGKGIRMHADTHVFDTNVADAAQLTTAEMTGRRQIRALMDMVRQWHPERADDLLLLALAGTIGARESRRFACIHRLTEAEVLSGQRFNDAIANGTYRVDIHHPSGGGYIFRYLDGREENFTATGRVQGRWREPIAEDPTCYQIPFCSMIDQACPNLILAGRMISADRGAFGAIRVMVNLNQVGEAAGVAARLMVDGGLTTTEIDPGLLRDQLAAGGSIIL